MGAVLLDTTVLIDVLRGRPEASERILALRRRGDSPYLCAVNAEEVARGVRGPAEESAAADLLGGLREAPLGREQGQLAGRWRRDHARRGRRLSQADCLVAAAAHVIGARLATGNPRDFPMRELEVEHWPTGR